MLGTGIIHYLTYLCLCVSRLNKSAVLSNTEDSWHKTRTGDVMTSSNMTHSHYITRTPWPSLAGSHLLPYWLSGSLLTVLYLQREWTWASALFKCSYLERMMSSFLEGSKQRNHCLCHLVQNFPKSTAIAAYVHKALSRITVNKNRNIKKKKNIL